jgi:hypothetical protein
LPIRSQSPDVDSCAPERRANEREPPGDREPRRPSRRHPWEKLMRRVFAVDVLVCGTVAVRAGCWTRDRAGSAASDPRLGLEAEVPRAAKW